MSELTLQERAWIGDAVLSLYMRSWFIESTNLSFEQRTKLFIHATSNQFLSALGKPTEVEARIGSCYEREGLAGAYTWISEHIVPLLLAQLKNKRLPLPLTQPPQAK